MKYYITTLIGTNVIVMSLLKLEGTNAPSHLCDSGAWKTVAPFKDNKNAERQNALLILYLNYKV